MPSNCTVATCRTDTNKSNVGVKTSLFRFPKDQNLRQIWMTKCNRSDPINLNNARICSLHFTPHDFQRDLKSELLNLPSKLILKFGAVPSLRLPGCQDRRKILVQRNAEECIPEVSSVDYSGPPISTFTIRENSDIHKAEHAVIQSDVETLKQKVAELSSENNVLKAKIIERDIKMKEHARKINSLQTYLRKLIKSRMSSQEKEKKTMQLIGKTFTPAQLSLLLKKKKVIHWRENDIAVAFTLRYLSKRAYVYLREHLNYPLPGLSTLERWASKFDLKSRII